MLKICLRSRQSRATGSKGAGLAPHTSSSYNPRARLPLEPPLFKNSLRRTIESPLLSPRHGPRRSQLPSDSGANFVSGSEGRPSDPEDKSIGLGGGLGVKGWFGSMTGKRIRGRRPSGTAVTASPPPTRSLSSQCDRTRKTVNQVKGTRHSRCCKLPLRNVRHAAKNSDEDILRKMSLPTIQTTILREIKAQFEVFHNYLCILLCR